MARFIVRRLLWMIPSILIVTFLVYVACRIGFNPVAAYSRANPRASEEKIDESGPAEDLLTVEGMDKELAYELASRGIRTREELADQSLDELESVPGLDPERAGKLIMAARAYLFESAEQA